MSQEQAVASQGAQKLTSRRGNKGVQDALYGEMLLHRYTQRAIQKFSYMEGRVALNYEVYDLEVELGSRLGTLMNGARRPMILVLK